MMHVRVGGRWMNEVAMWDEGPVSHDERGCKELTFYTSLPPGERPAAVRRGLLVEQMLGPCVMWSGFLDDLDWVNGEFHAKGFSYDASNYLSRDGGTGLPTAVPDTAVDRWIDLADPGPVASDGIPTTAFTATADGANTTAALLDSVADERGERWSVRADRVVRMAADATAPDYIIGPGVVELSNVSDEYASTVDVTYLDMSSVPSQTTRSDPEAAERFGYKEVSLNLTDLGPMTLARAQGFGDGLLAKGRARLGWGSAIPVTSYELLTAGGVPSDLALVRDGQVVRIYGTFDDLIYLSGRNYLDAVIGTVSYEGGDVVTIGPVGSVEETLSEFAERITEEAREAQAS